MDQPLVGTGCVANGDDPPTAVVGRGLPVNVTTVEKMDDSGLVDKD